MQIVQYNRLLLTKTDTRGIIMKKSLLAVLLCVFSMCMLCVACNPTNKPDNYIEGKFEITPYTGTSGFSNEIVLPTDIPSAEEPSLQLHYYRKNSADYKKWGFWIWQQGGDGALFNMNFQDDFGGVAVYPLSAFGSSVLTNGLGIIPRLQAAWTKDGDADRICDFSDMTPDANNYYHLYLIQGDISLYGELNQKVKNKVVDLQYGVTAEFDSERSVKITTATAVNSVCVKENDVVLAKQDTEKTANILYKMKDGKQADLDKKYTVEVTFEDGTTKSADVSITRLYSTDAFNARYYYNGDLGAIYSRESTTFKVWSPVSDSITLNIYLQGHGSEKPQTYPMTKGEKGVFSAIVNGDQGGKYYTYTVVNSSYPDGAEIVDPYAKSAGLDGQRGQIVDFSKTNPDDWDSVQINKYDRKQLTVWETHVADVTSSATWTGTEAYRKKFLGVIEQGTVYTQNGVTVKTGFDHIKELGVNAVQLIPVFDQANDESKMTFNWGYNPLNYNVLEGGYSTDATDGYVRIREFKQLVKTFADNGINIIMDVVYNHVNAAAGSNFDVLMPGYYYRYDSNGALSNGSGCGNETASENKMFSKFIIDSTEFWAREYKLGGFRFDLMGLHDVDTMNAVAENLQKISKYITVYGEPWTGGTSPLADGKKAIQKNANSLVNVGQFNDQMRDALIRGGLNGADAKGWVTNISKNYKASDDVGKIISGLKGVTDGGSYKIVDANKTVNYVTCHDNYTLYDRIVATGLRPSNEKQAKIIRNMAVLADSVVFTSGGTTFMLAGDEFLRTKGGNNNSYNGTYKENELDYSLKITNADVFEIFQKLITFKQNTKALQLDTDKLSSVNYNAKTLDNGNAIEITFTENNKQYKIVHANYIADVSVDFEGYSLVLDTIGGTKLSATTKIEKLQTIIACKG